MSVTADCKPLIWLTRHAGSLVRMGSKRLDAAGWWNLKQLQKTSAARRFLEALFAPDEQFAFRNVEKDERTETAVAPDARRITLRHRAQPGHHKRAATLMGTAPAPGRSTTSRIEIKLESLPSSLRQPRSSR